jgi:hypothetical protein
MSNRRQPTRQTRTNPARNATTSRALGGGAFGAQQEQAKPDTPPGFYPGIMHFTDAITALPKEMIRHYTMLKEVDAKIYHPQESLKRLVNAANNGPPPAPVLPNAHRDTEQGLARSSETASTVLDPADPNNFDALFDMPHRQLHLQLRMVANSMLGILDEKNHVIGTATDALERHLARCESSWPTIENEISETTRLGSLEHWAYANNSATEKKAVAEPRARRDAGNNLAALANASEHEPRLDARSVLHNRKQRNHQPDSDFDEPRPGKRTATGKTKKPDQTAVPAATGLGITNGAPSKKRKIEKMGPATGGHAMDRTQSSLYGSVRGGASPRGTPAAEPAKKRSRNTGALTGAVAGRKRYDQICTTEVEANRLSSAGTANSAANSPHIASSPVPGNVTSTPKVVASPAVGATMQRQTSTRGRQTSALTSQPARLPSTVSKETNGSTHVSAPDAPATHPPPPKNNNGKNTKVEETLPNDLNAKTASRTADRNTLKREESTNSRPRPPSITTNSRNNGKVSKTSTPVAGTFSEISRPRSGRNNHSNSSTSLAADAPIKRSHKKGGGIGAQQAAAAKAAAVAEAARKAVAPEDEPMSDAAEDDEVVDGELLYCYCQKVSYGEMIGCDGEHCRNEWFHLDCVGLARPPRENGKHPLDLAARPRADQCTELWFCDDCLPGNRRR